MLRTLAAKTGRHFRRTLILFPSVAVTLSFVELCFFTFLRSFDLLDLCDARYEFLYFNWLRRSVLVDLLYKASKPFTHQILYIPINYKSIITFGMLSILTSSTRSNSRHFTLSCSIFRIPERQLALTALFSSKRGELASASYLFTSWALMIWTFKSATRSSVWNSVSSKRLCFVLEHKWVIRNHYVPIYSVDCNTFKVLQSLRPRFYYFRNLYGPFYCWSELLYDESMKLQCPFQTVGDTCLSNDVSIGACEVFERHHWRLLQKVSCKTQMSFIEGQV